jgi:hypothetical protein
MQATTSRPFVVDGPYTISADSGPGARYCVRHTARSLDDLRRIGVIPRFVELEGLKRAVERATSPAFHRPLAERRLEA